MTPSARSSLEMLRSARFWCRSCAAAHKGMFDLAALAPEAWPGPLDHEPIGDLSRAPSARRATAAMARPCP